MPPMSAPPTPPAGTHPGRADAASRRPPQGAGGWLHRHPVRSGWPAALALGAVLLLAACGGGDDPGAGTSPGPTASPTPAASPSPTPAASPTPSPAPSPTPGAVAADCSAGGIDLDLSENPDLTGQANETRFSIIEAATACDYQGLAALTAADFTYSFGGGQDPAGHWRREEDRGEPALATLVTMLTLDVHVQEAGAGEDPLAGTLYTWPRAFQDAGSTAARNELEAAFGPERVKGWYVEGDYLGPRVGIRGDGAWIFFVAGD